MVLPTEILRNSYSTQAGQTYAMIDGLLNENKRLRAARDLLLPKLISGQLDVSKLDIATEEMTTA